jgi:hypothetical protein
VAIEQFGEAQDWTGLDRRVTDFAEAARDKIGLARQAIAQGKDHVEASRPTER